MYYESDNIELKREITNEIKKEIVAFLNTDGGVIFIGVNDDGSIYKDMTPKEMDIERTKIINWISQDIILPNPKEYISLEYNSDNVLEVVVNEGADKPYYLSEYGKTSKGVYLRFGSSKYQASNEDILKLEYESNIFRYEDYDSKKDKLTFTYYEKVKASKLITTVLKHDYYSNLDYWLSDEFNNFSKIYEVDNKNNIIKRHNFKGSILKQIDNMLNFFKTNYDETYYPILKEALLNSFIHRDYSLRDNIRVEITPYKINFISPGGINDLDLDYYNKKSTRNKKLKLTLKELGYTSISKENGIKRITKLCKELNTEPVIITTSKVFVLSISKK